MCVAKLVGQSTNDPEFEGLKLPGIDTRLNWRKEKKGTVFYQVQCALLYIENDAEISPAHYTWKIAEKGFKMAFMMNKLTMINSCEIILGK